jgi:hypothetical protein
LLLETSLAETVRDMLRILNATAANNAPMHRSFTRSITGETERERNRENWT